MSTTFLAHVTLLCVTLRTTPGPIVGLTEAPAEVNKLVPDMGQHTEEVLMETLGYSCEQLTALRDVETYWRKRREREQGKSVRGSFPVPLYEKGDRWLRKG